jgi:hypothetical protein
MYRVVQPWGPDVARQSTTISQHRTAALAFAAIDTIAVEMQRGGAPSDAVRLVVLDPDGRLVERPGLN